jgi:DNA-binding MarR family transcriptional regulator
LNYSKSEDDFYQLWILLRRVSKAIFKLRERELSHYNITPEQAGLLYVLRLNGNRASSSELARLMFREPHTVGGIVKRMTKQGFLRKSTNKARKNVIDIEITDKGEEAYQKTTVRKAVELPLSVLSEEERNQLYSYLSRVLAKAVKELEAQYKPSFLLSYLTDE